MKPFENLRVATRDDFTEFGEQQQLLIGLKFWVHTYHSDLFEEHQTWEGMDLERWEPWLSDGRIYIRKDARVKKRSPLNGIDQIEIDFS